MGARDPFDLVGTVVGEKYAIEEIVAEGGYSIVYRATHLLWKRSVAIKAFKLGEVAPQMREMLVDLFVREGALLAQLSERSAAICQARDVATFTGPGGDRVPYLVLEWLEGESLEAWVTRERARGRDGVALDEAIMLLRPAIEALALAHREGIAHCDVKPANFFVVGVPGRKPRTTKLLDFGIARTMRDLRRRGGHGGERTPTKMTGAYTPGYAAPEQFRPELGEVGPWSDVFALALILVEMVSGRDALEGVDLKDLAAGACDPHTRPTPRARGAAVSDDVEAVFACALSVRPSDRYPSAGQFLIALEGALRARDSRRTSTMPVAVRAREALEVPMSITRRMAVKRRGAVGSFVGTIGIVVGVAGIALAARGPAIAAAARAAPETLARVPAMVSAAMSSGPSSLKDAGAPDATLTH